MPVIEYRVSYEDAAATEILAKQRGWTENDSLLDFVDGYPPLTHRRFKNRDAALEWLHGEIVSGKTLFGAGDLDTMELIEARCRYCVCNGWRTTESFIVDDEGICEERADVGDDRCTN